MSAANKKFRQLDSKVHGYKANDHQRFKDQEITDKFPRCRGTFDNCPTAEELNEALSKKLAPNVCGKCPVYSDSGSPFLIERKFSQEELDELKRVFGKK